MENTGKLAGKQNDKDLKDADEEELRPNHLEKTLRLAFTFFLSSFIQPGRSY